MSTIPVFVVSLKDEVARREKMTQKMAALGLNFEFFDAVDGRQFDVRSYPGYQGLKRRLLCGKDLTGGEIGCLLSHRRIFEKMVAENIPAALILEDDAVLTDIFPTILKNLLDHSYPWQIVRFFGSPKVMRHRQRPLANLGEGHHLNRLSTGPGGTHAYVIRLEAARSLAKQMQSITYPYDMFLARPWVTGYPVLTVRPGLAIQDLSFESAIGDDLRAKKNKLSGWERAVYPLTRAWFKAHEAIMKRLSYWLPYFKDKKAYSNS